MSTAGKPIESIPVGIGLPQYTVQHGQRDSVQVSVLAQTVAVPASGPDVTKEGGCDCSIPPSAGRDIRVARHFAIAVIVVHVLALFAYGWVNLYQWLASLSGIVTGGILLCCYQREVYACVPLMFIVIVLFDLLSAILWVVVGYAVLAASPGFASLVTIAAIIYGTKASSSFDESSGMADAHLETVVVSQDVAPVTVVSHAPQFDYTATASV